MYHYGWCGSMSGIFYYSGPITSIVVVGSWIRAIRQTLWANNSKVQLNVIEWFHRIWPGAICSYRLKWWMNIIWKNQWLCFMSIIFVTSVAESKKSTRAVRSIPPRPGYPWDANLFYLSAWQPWYRPIAGLCHVHFYSNSVWSFKVCDERTSVRFMGFLFFVWRCLLVIYLAYDKMSFFLLGPRRLWSNLWCTMWYSSKATKSLHRQPLSALHKQHM